MKQTAALTQNTRLKVTVLKKTMVGSGMMNDLMARENLWAVWSNVQQLHRNKKTRPTTTSWEQILTRKRICPDRIWHRVYPPMSDSCALYLKRIALKIFCTIIDTSICLDTNDFDLISDLPSILSKTWQHEVVSSRVPQPITNYDMVSQDHYHNMSDTIPTTSVSFHVSQYAFYRPLDNEGSSAVKLFFEVSYRGCLSVVCDCEGNGYDTIPWNNTIRFWTISIRNCAPRYCRNVSMKLLDNGGQWRIRAVELFFEVSYPGWLSVIFWRYIRCDPGHRKVMIDAWLVEGSSCLFCGRA